MGILPLILPAVAGGIVLAAMLAYFGLHILDGRTFFYALSVSQMAALGSALAALLGMPSHSAMRYVISGACAIGAALAFDRTSVRRRETLLAVVYAVAAAGTSLVASGLPVRDHPADVLIVSLHAVAKTTLLYVSAAVILFAFRRHFETGVAVWRVLFAVLFGAVIVSSVAIAGVPLVFAYLVIPAVGASMFSDRRSVRLAIGWTLAAVVTAAGIFISVAADLPTGATIVCTFGLALAVMAAVWTISRKRALA